MSEKNAPVVVEEKDSKSLPKIKETEENGVAECKNTSKESFTDAQSEVSNEKDTMTPERSSKKSRKPRSRPATPQIKNGVENEVKPKILNATIEETEETQHEQICNEEIHMTPPEDQETNGKDGSTDNSSQKENSMEETSPSDEFILDSESYMDPLVLQSDEPCPELEFEETSDKDSGKYSPIISRCMTRRSQSRNIPTPKTPKSLDDQESVKGTSPTPTPDPEEGPKNSLLRDFNETDTSSNTDTLSTKVQVGSDQTRLDFSEGDSDFLSHLKHKQNNSFPRCISSRRSIRPLSDDIRKKSFKNSQRVNLSIPFFSSRDSVERAPSVKRKSRSETPEDRKRFKEESPGFMTRITSPLSSLRNKFSSVPNSTSTPKLTSYKDQKNHIGGDLFDQMETAGRAAEPENKWCSIM